jgi:hypothetical protein
LSTFSFTILKEFFIFAKAMIKCMPAPIQYVINRSKKDFTKNIFHTLNKGVYFLRL